MNALKKSLMAVAAVFAVAPSAAFAYPPQCWDVCVGYCDQICYEGTYRTTCGDVVGCFAPAQPSEETASVSTEQAQQSEDAALVCDAEQTPAVES
ncbi:hypothetical protein COCOR_04550 [Corallococcus coralloides DSM 2259]|uniref:Lipoprotein n=1 Tax=Corallococcus coralloides (strain ATCC 25202 / DSM 2259 / NBRC 100086 / M2) TaxID=1144275 RepID=H8MGS3_CORCM|nr:hypothetical protein [Corallococcus coralloides]AFE05887.1 hypothetical protein COCOR_04550 [Corallococcus coralloides DSM 2259]